MNVKDVEKFEEQIRNEQVGDDDNARVILNLDQTIMTEKQNQEDGFEKVKELPNINNEDAMGIVSKEDIMRGQDIEYLDEKSTHPKLKKHTIENVDIHVIPKLDETYNVVESGDIWNMVNFDEGNRMLPKVGEDQNNKEEEEMLPPELLNIYLNECNASLEEAVFAKDCFMGTEAEEEEGKENVLNLEESENVFIQNEEK